MYHDSEGRNSEIFYSISNLLNLVILLVCVLSARFIGSNIEK